MKIARRAIAATELLLTSPAALFMTALFVRNLQPLQYELAHTAQRIVTWYALRPRIGCGALLHSWTQDSALRIRGRLRID
ncbi:MAG TPA: hypothetical protein VLX58_03215 [Bryobacteraceae bacterium]|nr:hypothetical protein [Bryobacteraceae bacterium]